MRIEMYNLDGQGSKRCHVYDMPAATITIGGVHLQTIPDYWAAVTDVPCPIPSCNGTVRWAEAGYVPGYRICDECERHFLAKGTTEAPILVLVGQRRGMK